MQYGEKLALQLVLCFIAVATGRRSPCSIAYRYQHKVVVR